MILAMTKLSVNINKIATLRNARGGNNPNVLAVARDAEIFGAQGITVHPRPDERHIRYQDVRDIRPLITKKSRYRIVPARIIEALRQVRRMPYLSLIN